MEKKLKKEIGKWQLYFHFGKDYRRMELGWRWVGIGFLKFTSFPEAGERIWKRQYKGFKFDFLVWFPFDS
jgi:hypothetical protein